MRNLKKIFPAFLIVFLANLFPDQSAAQDTLRSPKKWSLLLEPYLMFPNMHGSTGAGNLPDVEVDSDPGDIFNKLQMGAMLYFEVANDRWAFNTDFIYMDLGQHVKTGTLINGGDLSAKQFAWELAGLRRLGPRLELGLGTLLNSIKAGVNINTNNIGGGTTHHSKEVSQTWVDPMLIARTQNEPGAKFIYSVRGEIGGFGIGADFTWQVQAYAGYRFSKLFQLTGGYRVIGIDYEKGSGQDRFLYNMATFGPVIRVGFNF